MKRYRIRRKSDQKFISAGYNRKSWWNVFPSQVIKYNSIDVREHEIVCFSYSGGDGQVIECGNK